MTRRPNGEGSFYQQKDKSWVYQVTYGRKEDGSPYRKAFKGRTRRSAKSAGRNGRKSKHASKPRKKRRRQNLPASKNSGQSSGTPSNRKFSFPKRSHNGSTFTKRRLPESRLPTQAIWIPTASTSPKPLAICRSTRSRRTLCRTIISKSRKPALEQIRRKAAYPRKPSIISICC